MSEKKCDVYIILTTDDSFYVLSSKEEAEKFIVQELSQYDQSSLEIYKANKVNCRLETTATIFNKTE